MITFRDSRKSFESYFKWRVKRSRSVIKRLGEVKRLKGLKILEVGCGYGALLSLLHGKGVEVFGVEADKESLEIARKFLKNRKGIKLFSTRGEKLPFDNEFFDTVVLFDVIEHVRRPGAMISECIRILKPGGILYAEFTPYYSIAGHHLYDITKLPIHILPEKFIKKIIYRSKPKGIFEPDDYWRDFKSLNKLRIDQFQKYAKRLDKIQERYIFKYPDVFEINLPFLACFGISKDILTMSFEGIYQKR